MLPNHRRLGFRGALAIGALLAFTNLVPSTAQAAFVGAAVRLQFWSIGAGTGSYALNLNIPTDPWSWELGGPISVYNPSGTELLATIDSLSVALDGDPAVNLNFAITAGDAASLVTITSSTVTFAALDGADAFATAALTLTDNNGNGASATGLFAGSKAYEARYNGGTVFANLISPISVGPGGSTIGTERDPITGTEIIPGLTTSIQSQFAFILSARDSASGTSRFQVNIPSNNIPEPSTWVLATLGTIGLFVTRRRFRR